MSYVNVGLGAVSSSDPIMQQAKAVLTACQAQPDGSPLMEFAVGDGVAFIEAGDLRGFQNALRGLISTATPGSSAAVKGAAFLNQSVPSSGGGGGTLFVAASVIGSGAWWAWKKWRGR